MLSEEGIKPASIEWPAPVVVAPEKHGSLRFPVNYQKLNAVTKQDVYQISHVDQCIDVLGEAAVFSTRDPKSGYW